MAEILCNIPCIVCAPGPGGGVGPVDPANPFINLSSETPDVDVFYGRRYGPGGGFPLPPLGSTWYASGCIGFCVSTVSQEDANLCAQRQAVLCAGTNWPVPDPFSPDPEVPILEPRPVFYNNAQIANFLCADGAPYSFTVAAGIFSAFNQDTADQMAYSYALNQGAAIRVCMGALSPLRTCAGGVYHGSIVASVGQGRATFIISSGAIPDGLVLSQNNLTLFLDGTPTTPGVYTFSVKATDPNGVTQTKSYTLSVFGIANPSPLPDATVGQPYSEILSVSGAASSAVVWAVSSGQLPVGLTLDSNSGEISGTPQFDGLQGFTISVTDSAMTCSKAFLMTVEEDGFDWSQIDWVTQDNGGGPGTVSASGDTAQFAGVEFMNLVGVIANFDSPGANVKVTLNGGPPDPAGSFILSVSDSFGDLLLIQSSDWINDGQVFNFVIPPSVGNSLIIWANGASLVWNYNFGADLTGNLVFGNQ